MELNNYKKYTWIAGTAALLGVAFASVAFGLSYFNDMKYPNGQMATVTVTGEAEVTTKPDIATVTFTVREKAKTVPEAQKMVENKIKTALSELKVLSVEEKDIKTNSYNVYPEYENPVCNGYVCPPYTPKISGYQVSQSVTVKVRKVDQAGEVLGLVGKANITEISGPDFTVDSIEEYKAEAKEKAIKEAERKAQELASSLGVSLGAIISFSDSDGGYMPMMYAKSAAMPMDMAGSMRAEAVSLPQGENVIKSNVSITYVLK